MANPVLTEWRHWGFETLRQRRYLADRWYLPIRTVFLCLLLVPTIGGAAGQFFLEQSLPGDSAALHYGALSAGDEQHYYGGLSLGRATIGAFHAQAHTVSQAPNALYAGLDQTFFYGGSRGEFQLQGLAGHVVLGRGMATQFATAQVSASGVEDRYGHYVGLQKGWVEAGGFYMTRGGDTVGHGLDLSVEIGRLGMGYQAVESRFDAGLQRVVLEWQASSRWQVSVAVEQARNDLFSQANNEQILFSIERRFGDEGVAESGGFNKAIGIGVGVGLAAVAVSSGSSDRDGAGRFVARDEAAFDVLNTINPVSVEENREHGGWIYRNADNTYSYTEPVAGTVNSVNIGSPVTAVPEGTLASASYHTHGGPDPRYDNENFSPQDLFFNRFFGLDGYLGTPSGLMKIHRVRTEQIQVLGTIAR